jgi:hypothetical protein
MVEDVEIVATQQVEAEQTVWVALSLEDGELVATEHEDEQVAVVEAEAGIQDVLAEGSRALRAKEYGLTVMPVGGPPLVAEVEKQPVLCFYCCSFLLL